MTRILLAKSPHLIFLAAISVSLILSCEKLPNPKFSYLPKENTEAGDQFAWNDAGEESFSELIPVNDPTVLGFMVSDSSGTIRLKNAEARTYHIQVIRQDEKGQWAYKGFTSTLHQNKVNLFTVACLRVRLNPSSTLFDN